MDRLTIALSNYERIEAADSKATLTEIERRRLRAMAVQDVSNLCKWIAISDNTNILVEKLNRCINIGYMAGLAIGYQMAKKHELASGDCIEIKRVVC